MSEDSAADNGHDVEFEMAREIAQAFTDATEGIPHDIRRLGLAIYIAAEAAAQPGGYTAAYLRVNDFVEMVMAQLDGMLPQDAVQ